MGLARAAVSLLLHEARQRPFGGRVATLGRQHVYVTEQELVKLAERHGVRLVDAAIELHREPSLAAQGFISDDCLLRRLGFTDIVRIDVSSYEACDEILDLNTGATPAHLLRRFDVVLDSGTLEHVFDLPAALRHCTRMVAPGGRVIHLSPTSNCVEHGFYSVSPTLFADYYAASGFRLNSILLCRAPVDVPRGEWLVYDYLNSPQRMIPLGMLDDQVWLTLSIATAVGDVQPSIPQQSFYEQTWEKASGTAVVNASNAGFEPGSKAARLVSAVSFSPRLTNVATGLISSWRKRTNDKHVRQHALPYPFIGRF